jgi:hypothetical protein
MPDATVLRHHTPLANLDSDNNIVYLGSGVSMAHTTDGGAHTHMNLADWQTSTGNDLASSVQDPLTPAGPGLGVWRGPAESYAPDLRFSDYPGPAYLQPAMPEVTHDIDGELRAGSMTTAGADEVPVATAVSNWMMY